MSETTHLLLLTGAGIISMVVLIAWVRIHAFFALLFASLLVGIGAGMEPVKVAAAFQEGMGGTLGSITAILALGTMLGGLLAASGGADVLARYLVKVFGRKHVHWCLILLSLAIGFTTWFVVGLVMLIPILLTLHHETKIPFLKLAIPMLAILSIMHGVMPPSPGPLVAIEALNADLGKVILWAFVAAIPIAAVSGPFFAHWVTKRVHVQAPRPVQVDPTVENREKPALWRTVTALLLPMVLILSHTLAELFTTVDSPVRGITGIIGNPTLALAISVLYAAWAFRFTRREALKIGEQSLSPLGMILLIVGAGGGLNRVLRECGAADAIGDMASSAGMPAMLFGWVCAALIRVATGSATVAITAACGLVAPLALSTPDLNRELLVVCVGCGSVVLSHLNDGGFWIVKETLGMTVSETFRTWTVTETLIGVVGLGVCWGLSMVF